jgi:two-component system sensor histidine kinase YesM
MLGTWVTRIRNKFRDMKVKHKLMVMLLLLTAFFCVIVMSVLQYVFRSYDDMLYAQSARTINYSITDIENAINNIEKLSMNIAVDSRIQEQLSHIRRIQSEYDRMQALTDFKNKIYTYVLTEKYLSSISFTNDYGYMFMVGQDSQTMDESVKEMAITKAKTGKGTHVWIEPGVSHPYLLGAREILSTGANLLEPLGTILFQINMDVVIHQHLNAAEEEQKLYIMSGKQTIYAPDDQYKGIDLDGEEKMGYKIQRINGISRFIAYTKSPQTGWMYYSILPYNDIFQKKIAMRYALIVTLFIFMLTVIIISYWLARSITKPIEHLTQQMKQAESGKFALIFTDSREAARADEVGYLQKRFLIMIQRINQLIEENYTRQILLKDTEYRALQAQVNPHFLYNTLTSINWMARLNKQEAISSMVESLSRLLRAAISSKEPIIRIREELSLVEDYIRIQKVRYEDRAEFVIDIDEKFHDMYIPKMTLQPIVENAIYHGLKDMLEICRIRVVARVTEEYLEIAITDNGPGMDEEILTKLSRFEIKAKGTGIGLTNIHERLKLQFGERFGLRFASNPGQGACITILLPKG